MFGYFLTPEFQRVILLLMINLIHNHWRTSINKLVPAPYLDEVFHIPQSQAYYFFPNTTFTNTTTNLNTTTTTTTISTILNRWTSTPWDAKLTTPPGLYIFAHYINTFRNYMDPTMDLRTTPNEWRYINAILWYLLLVTLYVLAAVGKRSVQADRVLQREFSILFFPLLFFFSGLFYTDLFSVVAVLVAQIAWTTAGGSVNPAVGVGVGVPAGMRGVVRSGLWSRKTGWQVLHVLLGVVALAARQTNVFWVAVYLAGLQVVETVKETVGVDQVHDPPIAQASLQDFVTTSVSLIRCALSAVPQLLLDLWPHLSLLGLFGAFVFWNGGVVLGDKSNHVATIHLAQMLYIWPLIVFFSWPVVLPLFTDLRSLRRRVPRATTIAGFTLLGLLVVHFNTIVHPFTLADNRHYTFYVFRILRSHWTIKYAAVPIYVVCGWLVITALGGAPEPEPSKKTIRILHRIDTASVSTTLVWLVATTLSLSTAPLVEPRYFIVPWLLWRLSVPEYVPKSAAQRKIEELDDNGKVKDAPETSLLSKALRQLAVASPYLELAWYLLINAVTGYVFLYKGFEWPQEPGQVQRFMW